MKLISAVVAMMLLAQAAHAQPKEYIVFFETPLECGPNTSIGDGSRAKPLLLDLEASGFVREAWLNHAGTYVAVVLAEPYMPLRQLLAKSKPIFDKYAIAFRPLNSSTKHAELKANFRRHGQWYRSVGVDSLQCPAAK